MTLNAARKTKEAPNPSVPRLTNNIDRIVNQFQKSGIRP